ncbi:MAG: BMP family ABC transporter substrate-binding protein [Oscillospiraceae bacterium]|nr:BMP family ABC transporter substrate-binding protein [Oscillospiraceae bacterium]
MKKIIAVLLAAVMLFAFAACGGNGDDKTTTGAEGTTASAAVADLKVGVILLHNETVGYDENFINAINAAGETLGVKSENIIFKKDINEDSACYDACVELVEDGCDLIFADSFGHEEFVIKAAKEYPDVQFFHATGTNSKIVNLSNFHNAFASIYQGRYLAGVIAGLKLNEMIEAGTITAEQAKMGYISAKPYAECISGYTSYYLGAKSVCPSATMTVTYTDSWADLALEQEAAKKLIEAGCVLISEHADTDGSPMACENAYAEGKTVYHVGYNVDFTDIAPKTNLVSSKIDWTPYFEHIFTAVAEGKDVETDYCGSLATGSVILTDYNDATVTDAMKAKVVEVKKGLEDGSIKVFDVSAFTVTLDRPENQYVKAEVDAEGHLTSFTADAVSDADFTPDTESVIDGEVAESVHRSAPYFNIIIDGIEIV